MYYSSDCCVDVVVQQGRDRDGVKFMELYQKLCSNKVRYQLLKGTVPVSQQDLVGKIPRSQQGTVPGFQQGLVGTVPRSQQGTVGTVPVSQQATVDTVPWSQQGTIPVSQQGPRSSTIFRSRDNISGYQVSAV